MFTSELEKQHRIVRELIMHENNLINYRMGWMTAVHAVLLGVAITELVKGNYLLVISTLGLAVSIITIWGVLTAQAAIKRLRIWWSRNLNSKGIKEKDVELPDIIGYGTSSWFWGWFTPAICVPLIFGGAWAVVIYLQP